MVDHKDKNYLIWESSREKAKNRPDKGRTKAISRKYEQVRAKLSTQNEHNNYM